MIKKEFLFYHGECTFWKGQGELEDAAGKENLGTGMCAKDANKNPQEDAKNLNAVKLARQAGSVFIWFHWSNSTASWSFVSSR
jgi:hypothetical protein